MSSYQGYMLFLLGVLLGLALYGTTTFFFPDQNTKKLLRCETKDKQSKIILMLDEKTRTVPLKGETISSEKIETFSDYLIYADWKHSK